MGNFQDRDNRGGGGFRGGDRGGRPPFKKSFGGQKDMVMHKATCSECGKPCEVPFRPTGEKPVFCRDCFASKREGGDRPAPRREFSDRAPRPEYAPRPAFDRPRENGNDDLKKQIESMNIKLDRVIRSLETMIRGESGEKKEIPKNAPVIPVKKPAEKDEAGFKKAVGKAVASVAPKKADKKAGKPVVKAKGGAKKKK